MRRQDKEIKDPGEIESILKMAHIVRLAMVNDGDPYIVPLNYGYKDNALYIHCAREGRKIDILRKNPRICFEIEGPSNLVTGKDACDWTWHYRSLIGYGTIEILKNKDEKMAGLDILMAHFGKNDNRYRSELVDAVYILKLNIDSITGKQSV
jgi:nitroimidazol reductase NimA-like FMN-containing flavoprotein (pyridoxamine 5'-phosphate oxidase superfamily)